MAQLNSFFFHRLLVLYVNLLPRRSDHIYARRMNHLLMEDEWWAHENSFKEKCLDPRSLECSLDGDQETHTCFSHDLFFIFSRWSAQEDGISLHRIFFIPHFPLAIIRLPPPSWYDKPCAWIKKKSSQQRNHSFPSQSSWILDCRWMFLLCVLGSLSFHFHFSSLSLSLSLSWQAFKINTHWEAPQNEAENDYDAHLLH